MGGREETKGRGREGGRGVEAEMGWEGGIGGERVSYSESRIVLRCFRLNETSNIGRENGREGGS